MGLKTVQELWQYGVPFRRNGRLTLCIYAVIVQSLPHVLPPWRDRAASLVWSQDPEDVGCVIRRNIELPRDAAEPQKRKSPL